MKVTQKNCIKINENIRKLDEEKRKLAAEETLKAK